MTREERRIARLQGAWLVGMIVYAIIMGLMVYEAVR